MIKTILTTALFLFIGSAYAADPDIYSHKKLGAVKGVDVVAYFSLEAGAKPVQGNTDIAYEYMGATWYFSSEENRELFAKNPEKYAPQYGGYCAYAVSKGSIIGVNPKYWHIVNDKLYLNYNWLADRSWRKDREAAIARADANWPTILSACEKDDSCTK